MRVLVAGAEGLVGTATVRALVAAGHDVVRVSRSASPDGESPAVAADLADPLPPTDELKQIDAVVNLVGIAREHGSNTFERAHINVTKNLLAFSHQRGIHRYVHVGVVDIPGASGPYQDTKRRADTLVRNSGLDWTVVRPALIYGPGDDMLSQLVSLVRAMPVFAGPAGSGPLQVVDVEDVAHSIVRSLEVGDAAIGKVFEIAGPERFSLSKLVHFVSASLGLRTITLPLPTVLMAAAATLLEWLLPNPPVTRSQLGMLVRGLYGDTTAAEQVLGLSCRPLVKARVLEVAATVPVLPSLRLAPTAAHHRLLERAARIREVVWFAPLLVVALLIAGLAIPDIWTRMFVVNAAAAAIVVKRFDLPWRKLAAPSVSRLGVGVAVAGLMVGAGVAVTSGLARFAPSLLASASDVYGWADTIPAALSVGLLIIIATLEDVVWRFAIGLPLCARLGPAVGCIVGGAAFAVAHATSGPTILILAAFLAGTVWTALAVRSRSVVTVASTHILWDLCMLWLAPS